MTALVLAFTIPFWGADPSPAVTRSKARSERLDCVPVGVDAERQARPGRIKEGRPRGDYVDRTVFVCSERLMRPGLRHPRDAAILTDLDATIDDLATAAASVRPDLADRTWLVESFYPNPQMNPKIRFASQVALMRQGLAVSDRTPMLSAGDLEVILDLPPSQAYPTACARYARTGTLREGDALLAIVHRDPRETALHAAICADGQWMWVR